MEIGEAHGQHSFARLLERCELNKVPTPVLLMPEDTMRLTYLSFNLSYHGDETFVMHRQLGLSRGNPSRVGRRRKISESTVRPYKIRQVPATLCRTRNRSKSDDRDYIES